MRWVAVVLSVVGLMACLPASTQGETFTPGFAYTQYAFKIGDGEFFRNDVLRLMGKDDHVDVDVYLMLEDDGTLNTPKTRIESVGLALVQVILGPEIPSLSRPQNDWSSLISAVANPRFRGSPPALPAFAGYLPEEEFDHYDALNTVVTNNTATIRISELTSAPAPFAYVKDQNKVSEVANFGTDGFGILLGTFTFTGMHAGSVKYWTQGSEVDSASMLTKAREATEDDPPLPYLSPLTLWPSMPVVLGGDDGNISLTIEVVAVPLPSVAWSAILGLAVLGISRTVGRSRLHA
jgi:hypothetical protein